MSDKIICAHCASEKLNKAGFTKNNKQRFYCRSCRRFSRENPVRRVADAADYSDKCVPRQKNLPSKSHLILKLQALGQSLGRTPTTADVVRFSKTGRGASLDTYYDVFGSFTEAVRSAKLPLRYHQSFNAELLLAELRVLRKKLKRALLSKDVDAARKRGEVSPPYHFQRAFGSVPQAIEQAGASREKFTRRKAADYLRELSERLDRVPTR